MSHIRMQALEALEASASREGIPIGFSRASRMTWLESSGILKGLGEKISRVWRFFQDSFGFFKILSDFSEIFENPSRIGQDFSRNLQPFQDVSRFLPKKSMRAFQKFQSERVQGSNLPLVECAVRCQQKMLRLRALIHGVPNFVATERVGPWLCV